MEMEYKNIIRYVPNIWISSNKIKAKANQRNQFFIGKTLRKIKKKHFANRVNPVMMITSNFHPFSINTELNDLTDLTIITPNYTALRLIVKNK